MGIHDPMPPGSYGVIAVSSSSDNTEGWTDGVFPVHVLSNMLFFGSHS